MFHHFFLRDHGPGIAEPPYGRFGEGMSHIHAAAITRSPFTVVYTTQSEAETLDYNGKYVESLGNAEQADMDFYSGPVAADASLNCSPPDPDPCCALGTVAQRGDCALKHSTGWDWRIFYDLPDNNSFFREEPIESFVLPGGGGSFAVPDFDSFDGRLDGSAGTHLIMDVVLNYLGRGSLANPDYADRGRAMLDVVDVLDGMSCRGHMTVASTEDMLHEVMGYDYDFFYDATSCP